LKGARPVILRPHYSPDILSNPKLLSRHVDLAQIIH
jgi:hypothetical protein